MRDRKPDDLYLGAGSHANVKILFSSPQTYYGFMGILIEQVDNVMLCVTQPDQFDDIQPAEIEK